MIVWYCYVHCLLKLQQRIMTGENSDKFDKFWIIYHFKLSLQQPFVCRDDQAIYQIFILSRHHVAALSISYRHTYIRMWPWYAMQHTCHHCMFQTLYNTAIIPIPQDESRLNYGWFAGEIIISTVHFISMAGSTQLNILCMAKLSSKKTSMALQVITQS